ncbi:MAG: ParB/RepB/Spo0J family partition protein [Flavobacteriales bacterium]|nr:ParB/RepB/Spo0J family partition protein [Flavobacteriales bacterium]
MNNKKSVLGRGLGSILRNPETDITTSSNNKESIVGNINTIKIDVISTNPFQPRSEFDQEKLEELSHSIKTLGIIQPITVRKLGNDKYQLISGERRLRASKMAGKTEIPAFIRIANDHEMLEMALVENIQRSNLNPIEIALTYQRLMEECKLTQEQCSERVGKKRSSVANFLRLLKLPKEIQLALQHSSISMGHARALINVKDLEIQMNIFNDVVANGFSVREVEQLVRTFADIGYKQTSKPKTPTILNSLPFSSKQKIHNLSNYLEKDIDVKRNKKGKGKLIIPFNSDDDFISLIGKISEKS